MSSHALTKRQLREQRRAERQAAEAAAKARAARRRRLWQLGAAAGLAAAVVVAAIVLSSGGAAPRTQEESAALFRGIPERNGVLGNANAPITVTEYLDLQCPACANASHTVLPTLVNDYVRPGEVKLQARLLHFLGPDSVRGARVAAGAAEQGRLWPFLESFYAAQGTENSGYVTDGFLRDVAAKAGVDADQALAFADTNPAERPLAQANADAGRLGIDGTPTFTIKRGDGAPKVVSADELLAELAR